MTDEVQEILTYDGYPRHFDADNRDQYGYFLTIQDYTTWWDKQSDLYKKKHPSYGSGRLPKTHHKNNGPMRVRRGAFIMAYVGPNGSGKSLCMINDTLPTLEGKKFTCYDRAHRHNQYPYKGERRVLSSVRLIDPRTGDNHPLWEPLDDFRKLLYFFHGDILMDEVSGIMSASESTSIPVQIKNMMYQMRRRDVFVRWTTPNWLTAAPDIRRITRAVTDATGTWQTFVKGRDWPSNAHHKFKTYEMMNYETFNQEKKKRMVPETFEWYWQTKPKNLANQFYDTIAEVLTAGATNDAGLCLHCGGRRTTPSCSCHTQPGGRAFVDSEENLARIGRELFPNMDAADEGDPAAAEQQGAATAADRVEHDHHAHEGHHHEPTTLADVIAEWSKEPA